MKCSARLHLSNHVLQIGGGVFMRPCLSITMPQKCQPFKVDFFHSKTVLTSLTDDFALENVWFPISTGHILFYFIVILPSPLLPHQRLQEFNILSLPNLQQGGWSLTP